MQAVCVSSITVICHRVVSLKYEEVMVAGEVCATVEGAVCVCGVCLCVFSCSDITILVGCERQSCLCLSNTL